MSSMYEETLKKAAQGIYGQPSAGQTGNRSWDYGQQETLTLHPISKLYQRRDELQKHVAEIDYLIAQAEQPDVRKVLDLLHRVESI